MSGAHMRGRDYQAAHRLSWFLFFVVSVVLIVGLYFVKTHAQSARRDVHQLTASIAREDAMIQVLRAELAALEGPERLSALNEQHLGLVPIVPSSEASSQDLEVLLPVEGVVGNVDGEVSHGR